MSTSSSSAQATPIISFQKYIKSYLGANKQFAIIRYRGCDIIINASTNYFNASRLTTANINAWLHYQSTIKLVNIIQTDTDIYAATMDNNCKSVIDTRYSKERLIDHLDATGNKASNKIKAYHGVYLHPFLLHAFMCWCKPSFQFDLTKQDYTSNGVLAVCDVVSPSQVSDGLMSTPTLPTYFDLLDNDCNTSANENNKFYSLFEKEAHCPLLHQEPLRSGASGTVNEKTVADMKSKLANIEVRLHEIEQLKQAIYEIKNILTDTVPRNDKWHFA